MRCVLRLSAQRLDDESVLHKSGGKYMKNLEEQIKQWNDENEFEKCVEAIEAMP